MDKVALRGVSLKCGEDGSKGKKVQEGNSTAQADEGTTAEPDENPKNCKCWKSEIKMK